MSPSISTLEPKLDAALEAVCHSDVVTRPQRAQRFLSHVPAVLRQEGIEELYARAARFDLCGGFAGTPWDRPARLRPRLWAGSFAGDPPYPWMEVMSTMRMLAIALGEHVHEDVDQAAALRFLERVLSLNIDKLFEAGTEASRMQRVRHHEAASAVLKHVLQRLPALDFLRGLAEEVDAIMAQRPVWTHHVRATLRLVAAVPGADTEENPLLDRYVEAVLGPTPVSMRFREPDEYREALAQADLDEECRLMGQSMRRTGLACQQHGELLRHVDDDPKRLGPALGLDERGQAGLEAHPEVIQDIIERTINPASAQTAYGLARCLERGVLERPEVQAGLLQLTDVEVDPGLAEVLQAAFDRPLPPADILLGGAIRVLGQPLGIGQGANPTCQSARGISLWAQYRPGYLLDALTAAAQGDLPMAFESHILHSSQLEGGLAPRLDPDLDPVSLALVPHLDKLYDAMMRLAGARGDDPHRWVNPALYGQIVPPGFSTCFDPVTWHVRDHGGFIRRFMATFHPDHNDGHFAIYASPVGISVTDDRGRLLGLHAVTLQRVDVHDDVLRAYFYNPNNEGRQNWGDGVEPTVHGNGETEGESSLPLDQFASRIYAFHHPVHVPGDPQGVSAELVRDIEGMARRTWGRNYVWPHHP